MQDRIIKVFYGNDALPYKDKENTIHFPIIGSAFMNSSNVAEIRFYADKIGGSARQWIVIGKLPNGKRVWTFLGQSIWDSEEEDYYYSFSLNQAFTQAKGDLYLSLGGYNGDVQELDQLETYEMSANTIVEMTGAIKLNIAYATPLSGSDTDIDTWQGFLGALGEKLDITKGIVVLEDTTVSVSGYENGQVFYVKADNKLYIKDNGALIEYHNPRENDIGIVVKQTITSGTTKVTVDELKELRKKFSILIYQPISVASFIYVKSKEPADNYIHFYRDITITQDATSTIKTDEYKINLSTRVIYEDDKSINLYNKTQADNTFPKKAGTESISGDWTFTIPPKSSQNASNDEDLVRKTQLDSVDDKVDQEVIDRGNADNTLDGKIALINNKIPSEASSSNKLVDEERMNSTINSMAAFFRGNFDNYETPQAVGNTTLMGVAWQTEHKNQPNYVSNNDYAYVNDDETHDHEAWRYIYVEGTGWQPQFRVNEAPLTASQINALNSGITSTLVAQITKNQNNISSDTYDSDETYNENDVVIYDGVLYQCQENNVTGTWDSTKWVSVSLLELYYNFNQSVNNDLRKIPQYVDINIVVSDWDNFQCEKSSGVTDLTNDDVVLCLPNGYMNDAYIRTYDIKLVAFDNATGVATFECTTTPSETINLTLQILRK